MRENTQIQTHPILLHGICKKDIQTQGGKGEEIDHLHHAVENCECGEMCFVYQSQDNRHYDILHGVFR